MSLPHFTTNKSLKGQNYWHGVILKSVIKYFVHIVKKTKQNPNCKIVQISPFRMLTGDKNQWE